MSKVLANSFEFTPERDAEIFSSIPAAPAVFLLRGDDPQADPYVSKTANLRRRLLRLLGNPEERTRKLNLRDRIRRIAYSATGSDFESGFLLYQALRQAFPRTYESRLRIRPSPLVKLHLDNEYPRASITTRLGRSTGPNIYYGPFASRAAAEKFANDALDFFKMRRCVEDLHPDPAFPGCIYSEMKMCLAPCFRGCTDDDYRVEVARVQNFFDTAGDSLMREIATQREQASADLRFEDAAAHHARLDKLKPVLVQLPEIVHRVDRLNAVIIQPSAKAESVALFRVDAGLLSGPIAFSIQQELLPGGKTPSMEARLERRLAELFPTHLANSRDRMEHLAILKRWYYRSHRVGEIFFADDKGALPIRRLVRAVSRVYRGEKPEQEPLVRGQ
jgi:excinuclease UvrABC nuclease subunit